MHSSSDWCPLSGLHHRHDASLERLGRSGQAATVSLERRESVFPRVRVENHATVIVVYGKSPAAGGVTRRERGGGNLIEMIATGRSISYNLDDPVQAIGSGKHLTVTVDDSGCVKVTATKSGGSGEHREYK